MGVPWTIGNIQTEIFIRKKFYSLARIYRIKDISRMCPFGTHTLFACVSLRDTHALTGALRRRAPLDKIYALALAKAKRMCPFGTHIPERGASPPAIYAWGTLVPHALYGGVPK